MTKTILSFALLAGFATLLGSQTQAPPQNTGLAYPGEKHLRNVRQLTFGGQNYFLHLRQEDRV